ncbi:MAG: RIP metalloprotease RseP [Gammaproteobacteria bacterium]|nr:RIP metalloprotease RseP [Gammaproteobacteria bacterium]MCG3146373.1 Regulator of sigma-E protease RseP [Gammaproteobacteria bacterium]
MTILHSIAAFIVAVGLLVTIHEFGHFWVAKRLGVKILRFSIGFGRPLWQRRFGSDRTELVVAALPLGGYVKMLDEREGSVAAAELGRAFNRQALWKRSAIVLAGPMANFFFAVFAYSVTYMLGIEGIRPVIGDVEVGSVADGAGLRKGQEVLALGDEPTPTWGNFTEASFHYLLEGEPLPLEVRNPDGTIAHLQLPVGSGAIDDMAGGRLYRKLGFSEYIPEHAPVVNRVIGGGAAARAGLRAGDVLARVDGTPVTSLSKFIGYIEAHPGQRIDLEVTRDGTTSSVEIVPDAETAGGRTVGRIRAELKVPAYVGEELRKLVATERYDPLTAIAKGWRRTIDTAVLTLRLLGKMLVREASVENISGPISIAKFAGETASLGLSAFIGFLAVVSVSLFVLNMLPVPLLDGGHLMYYLIELVMRRPVPESVQAIGQQVGIALLLALMGLAFYNDLTRVL